MKHQLRQAISAISPASVGAILLFVIAAMIAASLSRPVQNMFDDVMISVVSPYRDPGDEIVVIAITEETLAKLSYREPIDRGFLADLVARIDAASPRAIGVDILFDQPTEPEKDNRLARVLQSTSSPLVLASASTLDGLTTNQAHYIDDFAPKVSKGLAALLPDPEDGVIRRLFYGRQESGIWRPGFAYALAAAGGAHPTSAQSDLAYFHQFDALPYHFKTFPAQTIQVLPPSWLAGKFILIGVDLPSNDRYVTPFAALNGISGGALPGVVIHAHGLAQLLTGAQISRAPLLLVSLMTVIAGSVAIWLALRSLPILLKPLILFTVIGAIGAGAIFLFWQFRILIPVVWPSVLIGAAFSSISFIAWRKDNNERRYLRHAFGQYVSPAVVESVLKDPSSLRLGGERRAIISIFTDLEGFTALSEYQAPEETADQLNAYLDRICNLFVMYGATIDKIVGDSVVGFFGAPTFHQDQADHAISLALDIDAWAEEYRGDLAKRDVKLGTTRIGIHGGPAVVGNFGGSRFFDYTAIGDAVNTASRLEGANRHLGTRICVSESVAKATQSHQYRPAAMLYLKGKLRGIEVFEPLAATSPARKYQMEYAAAYQMMNSGSPGACAAFAKLAADHPEDHLVALHHSRLSSGKAGTDISLMEK